jgi:hypothetical protein
MSSNFACLSTGSSMGVLIGILGTLRFFNNWQK